MNGWARSTDRHPTLRALACIVLPTLCSVRLPTQRGHDLWLLLNHFKSKGYGAAATSNARRRRQTERVAEILGQDYNLRGGATHPHPVPGPDCTPR